MEYICRVALREFLVGLYALCDHLVAQGIRARVLDDGDPERPEKRFLERDLGWVKVEERAVSLVAIRFGGTLGLHPSNWSTSFALGPVPLSSKKIHPVQYHFVVPKDPTASPRAFEAKLRVETSGLLRREVTGVRWDGGRMAGVLAADKSLRRDLRDTIAPHEGVKVVPDERARFVRIVYRGRLVFGFNLLSDTIVHVDRGLPSARMVDAIERIAAKVAAG